MMTIKGMHPLAELLAGLLHGIEVVPPAEQSRMIDRAIREAVKWHEEHKRGE